VVATLSPGDRAAVSEYRPVAAVAGQMQTSERVVLACGTMYKHAIQFYLGALVRRSPPIFRICQVILYSSSCRVQSLLQSWRAYYSLASVGTGVPLLRVRCIRFSFRCFMYHLILLVLRQSRTSILFVIVVRTYALCANKCAIARWALFPGELAEANAHVMQVVHYTSAQVGSRTGLY
jgi:hypothetical protein